MIQYIIAAGVGALLGSSTKKGRKSYDKGGQTDKGLEQSLKRFEEIRRASELSDAQARQRRRLRQHQTGMSAGAFAKGGEIDEDILVVDVVWRQLNEKGLGKFRLKESDVERLEDNYGSTYYFEPYDYTNEKPISYTKMKNILDKSMKEMGLMDSNFAKGGEVTTDEALAKAEYLEDYGVDAEQLDDQYLGEWDSPEDFVASWIDDTGGMEGLIDPERFYEIDRIGFREWAINMADSMVMDIDEDNVEEYAERHNLEDEFEIAKAKEERYPNKPDGYGHMDRFVEKVKEEEHESIVYVFEAENRTAEEVIANIGSDYGMSLDDLESNYLIQPDYTAIADAFEDDGYVYIKKGGKTFVFNYNMKRGGRTKRMKKGGYVRPKNLALPERHYQTLADAIDKVVDHYGKEEIKDYIERNGAQGRYAVYRQATNRIWMDDDNANLRGDRFGIKHDPDWLTRTRMYTDANFDSATKSILKQKLGTKTMAKGGKTGRETITYNVYNVDGNVIRSAESIADFDKGTITLPNGKTFKVKPDLDFTMKFQKTQIKAKDGLEGLVRTMKEFSRPDSAFNILYAEEFAPKEMEKGGTTKKPRKKVSDFDKLAMKVASNYRGKAVPKKYQSKYGKRYDNEEAMEVGRAVASKVYRQQQAKKGKK